MNQILGKITIIVDDKPKHGNKLQYGFIKSTRLEDVFFNTRSLFLNTSFEELKVGASVLITVKHTDRGPFAESLTLLSQQLKKKMPLPPTAGL